jgi:hypothetical protein
MVGPRLAHGVGPWPRGGAEAGFGSPLRVGQDGKIAAVPRTDVRGGTSVLHAHSACNGHAQLMHHGPFECDEHRAGTGLRFRWAGTSSGHPGVPLYGHSGTRSAVGPRACGAAHCPKLPGRRSSVPTHGGSRTPAQRCIPTEGHACGTLGAARRVLHRPGEWHRSSRVSGVVKAARSEHGARRRTASLTSPWSSRTIERSMARSFPTR